MEDRYSRQKQVSTFGIEGQMALQNARVLIVGCGGLGCPVAMYLSRAGVLNLGLIDGDTVNISNLHRQILFNESDVGTYKVDAAKKALLLGNSDLSIETYRTTLNGGNFKDIISDYDLVIDCSDNFETRYLINDACIILNKPLVYGAANQLEGQVAVFNYQGSGNLRDLFPKIPDEGTIQNCEEAGVLGVVTGIIGDMMALESIKVISGIGEPLTNKLLQFNGETSRSLTITYKPKELTDKPIILPSIKQISWDEYNTEFNTFQLVDVRTNEERMVGSKGGIHIPLTELSARLSDLNGSNDIAFYCKTGKRAKQAARLISESFGKSNCIAIVDKL